MASSVTGRPIPVDRGLIRLRHLGARGGVVYKHRSMLGLRWTTGRVLRAITLALLGFAGLVAGLPSLGRLYATFFARAADWLALPATGAIYEVPIGTLLTIPVPYLTLEAPWPATWHWLVVGGLTLAAIVASFALPARFLPARYFLRFVAMVQSVSLVYFWLASPPFLYPLPGYLAGMLSAGLAVLALVPFVLGFGFYIFDHSLRQQVALTVMLVGHLIVFLPLQVLIHGGLSHHLSALVQPTLFLIFGLLLEVLIFVAFYGWAMSWEGTEIPGAVGPEVLP